MLQRKLLVVFFVAIFFSQKEVVFAQVGVVDIHHAFQVAVARHVDVAFRVGMGPVNSIHTSGVDVGGGRVITIYVDPARFGKGASELGEVTLNGEQANVVKTDREVGLTLLRYATLTTANNLASPEIGNPKLLEQLVGTEIVGNSISVAFGSVFQITPGVVHMSQMLTTTGGTANYTGAGLFSRNGALVGIVSGLESNIPGHGAHTLMIPGAVLQKFLGTGVAV